MKQCPVCNEVFDNQKAFCDMDGSTLVDQRDFVRAESQAVASAKAGPVWITGVIGGLIGIIVCVLLYIAFLAPGRPDSTQQDRLNTPPTETVSVKPTQTVVTPVTTQLPLDAASPAETETPEEAEPSPSASPATVATAPVPPASLNDGPIATGGKAPTTRGERAIIKMKDGSLVEADAAWEDAQGIWFRRSGLVSFVEKSRVEAITEAERRPAAGDQKSP